MSDPSKPPRNPAAWPQASDILYLDNHLLAVRKPAGLPSQPGGSSACDATTLARDWVKERFARPGRVWLNPVHRLDQPVAGVLLFARTSKAAGRLAAQLRERRMIRSYLAVVAAVPDALPLRTGEQAVFRDCLDRGRDERTVKLSETGGQEAVLMVQLLAREAKSGCCLLAIELESGRRHQIRAQLAARGCPILGDRRYASADIARRGDAPALYAWRLVLEHPVRHEPLTILSRPPATGVWQSFAPTIDRLISSEGEVK